MSDKIAEIRARHELQDPWPQTMKGATNDYPGSRRVAVQAHADRADLLTEIDRLQSENKALRERLQKLRETALCRSCGTYIGEPK